MDNLAASSQVEHFQLWETENRSGILITVQDKPGQLAQTLAILAKYNINLTSIHSRPPKQIHGQRVMNFHIDFTGTFDQPHIQRCAQEIREQVAVGLVELGSEAVPWFPTKIDDFDFIGKRILGEGDGIQEADHPGFRDKEYRKRRQEIAQLALDYKVKDPCPRLKYTE